MGRKKLVRDVGLFLDRLESAFDQARQEGVDHLLVLYRAGQGITTLKARKGEVEAFKTMAGDSLLFGLDTVLPLDEQIQRLPSDLVFIETGL